MSSVTESTASPLSASQIEDLRLASSKMTGVERRSFQAAMALKYCGGNAREAERLFGWGRHTVQLGLHERRTGLICLGAQAAFCGSRLWEEQHPQVAQALWALVEGHSQQDPTFRTALSYTRLTAAEALKQLRAQGFPEEQLPLAQARWQRCSIAMVTACARCSRPNPKKTPGDGGDLCQPRSKGWQALSARKPQRRRTDQALEHRLQSHGQDW